MPKHHYQLVDVFTDRQFGGNPLAVFPDATEIPEKYFQQIARELNLSETTFVLPPKDSANDFHVRIFTPAVELPMAGHPTLGTAFVLAREGRIPASEGETSIVFEEGVGPIPVTVRFANGAPDFVTMNQLLPEFGPEYQDRAACAAMLSLQEADLLPDAPCQRVSCGAPVIIVPLRDLSAIQRIRVNTEAMKDMTQAESAIGVYALTLETESKDAKVHGRMFAPNAGIAEDPATGGTAGPLGSYLVRHGLVKVGDKTEILSEQGIEMGRPSLIHITIAQTNDEISDVKVGGRSVHMGGGWLELP